MISQARSGRVRLRGVPIKDVCRIHNVRSRTEAQADRRRTPAACALSAGPFGRKNGSRSRPRVSGRWRVTCERDFPCWRGSATRSLATRGCCREFPASGKPATCLPTETSPPELPKVQIDLAAFRAGADPTGSLVWRGCEPVFSSEDSIDGLLRPLANVPQPSRSRAGEPLSLLRIMATGLLTPASAGTIH